MPIPTQYITVLLKKGQTCYLQITKIETCKYKQYQYQNRGINNSIYIQITLTVYQITEYVYLEKHTKIKQNILVIYQLNIIGFLLQVKIISIVLRHQLQEKSKKSSLEKKYQICLYPLNSIKFTGNIQQLYIQLQNKSYSLIKANQKEIIRIGNIKGLCLIFFRIFTQ
eukprot:TRINITY_DN3113_c0_g1_i10.p3 TRINITY_DN3113_c0_g1~~TRINITY_DN3113_c0_g1_i10.p3  ORF type:complete len:194 (-),score=-31.01 TRINITY_DN3113_c0_g1_i10:962-1465(-)